MNNKVLRHLVDSFSHRRGIKYFYGPFLSAAIAGRNDEAIRLVMKAACNDGISSIMINEIILQSHLFLGFPAMIEASRMFAGVKPRSHNCNRLPSPYSVRECRKWNSNGLAKIRRIYASAFERLVPYINSFSPQILTWMVNDGYGQVLSRPGASFPLRELSVVATLTVTSYTNQLRAHIRGALNVGVEPELLGETIGNCRFFCNRINISKARKVLSGAVSA